MSLPTPRPGLRLVNGSNQVAKLDVRLLPGEEATLPEGAVAEPERFGVRPVAAPAPAEKKAAAKKSAKS